MLVLGGADIAVQASTDCARLVRNLRAGAVASSSDFEASACGGKPVYPFVYDQTLRAVRATRDMSAGEVSRASPKFALASVRPGETVRVRVKVGVVSIERSVKTLQPARPGTLLFVVGNDGAVFAVDQKSIQR